MFTIIVGVLCGVIVPTGCGLLATSTVCQYECVYGMIVESNISLKKGLLDYFEHQSVQRVGNWLKIARGTLHAPPRNPIPITANRVCVFEGRVVVYCYRYYRWNRVVDKVVLSCGSALSGHSNEQTNILRLLAHAKYVAPQEGPLRGASHTLPECGVHDFPSLIFADYQVYFVELCTG